MDSPTHGIGAISRIGREIQCLLYVIMQYQLSSDLVILSKQSQGCRAAPGKANESAKYIYIYVNLFGQLVTDKIVLALQ